MRKEGIEPKDIPSDIVDPFIENIMKQPDEVMFKIFEVFDFDFKIKKSTFEWYECENCGEITFIHGLRIKEGKKVCISCLEK